MSNATVSRLGQVNAQGDALALFLKVFSGEVLTTFDTRRVMDGSRQMLRNISSGKSAQFPAIGTATAAYHTPGVELVGNVMNHAERNIAIDDMLIADVFVAQIDELMNHYDVRQPYAHEVGEELANTYDAHTQQVLCLASRAAATVTGNQGGGADGAGTALIDATFDTSGTALAAGMFDAAEVLDTRDIPDSNRYLNVRPAQYYNLIQNTDILNKDWGGQGSYAEGTAPQVAGIKIVKTNQLPSTNVTSGPTAYRGNFTNTYGVVYHKAAVGTVQLLGITPESDWDIRRQGWLILAKMAVGHGILRPECSVELAVA
jgi:hypothetical protein